MEHMRVVLAARKSRKSTDAEGTQYERQDNRAADWAERDGHTIVHRTADTKSGTVQPWNRKSLGPWMTEPAKLALYDALLVSDLDRLSRAGQVDFVDIEGWANRTGKTILVRGGLRYPARTDAERGDWDAKKRSARNYWEDVRDKHADTRGIILANGSAIGRPPFGYTITGEELHKSFTADEVNAPLALEIFQRIADGKSAQSVAAWVTELTGQQWRTQRVIKMVRSDSFKADDNGNCQRDGHTYPAIITRELYDQANAAQAARSFTKAGGGGHVTHAYSSVIYCACGGKLTHHQSTRDGKPVGQAKYRCEVGRRNRSEARCGNDAILFELANAFVDSKMSDSMYPDAVLTTTGGDAAKQAELDTLRKAQTAAVAAGDMAKLSALVADYETVAARPSAPIETRVRLTGKTLADIWSAGNLADRRALLASGVVRVTVTPTGAELAYGDDAEEQDTTGHGLT